MHSSGEAADCFKCARQSFSVSAELNTGMMTETVVTYEGPLPEYREHDTQFCFKD
jgi:hypothetical protein